MRAARHLHAPVMTHEHTCQRATKLSGYVLTRDALVRIENQQRSAYDYEVLALSLALGVDVRFLLGLTDDPGSMSLGTTPEKA